MLSKFLRYVEKVYDFDRSVHKLKDSRLKPQIPTSSVWLSGFLMYLTRRGSLNAMEKELRLPKRLDGIIGCRKPSADTIGRVYGLMDPEQLRQVLSQINHKLGRNKALQSRWPIRIAAVDAHEFFSQYTSLLPDVLYSPDKDQKRRNCTVLPPGGGL
jgi:hypothetical protein